MTILNQIINGIQIAYMLCCTGLWGIRNCADKLAHGEIIMVGSYFTWYTMSGLARLPGLYWVP